MDWYIVTKTINGRRYLYRQKTWREGRRVRTRSEYIGPAGPGIASGHRDTAGAETLQLPFPASKIEISPDAVLKKLVSMEVERFFEWRRGWDEESVGETLVEQREDIEQMVERLGVKRTCVDEGAFYSPMDDTMNIPKADRFFHQQNETATESYYATLLHELVHWTKGKVRSGRIQGAGTLGYAREELVAELGSMMLCEHFGFKPRSIQMHAVYFRGWLSRSGSKSVALKYAKYEAERAVRYILERGIISE